MAHAFYWRYRIDAQERVGELNPQGLIIKKSEGEPT